MKIYLERLLRPTCCLKQIISGMAEFKKDKDKVIANLI